MSSLRVFITGVSGYLGGHTTMRIIEKHPEWKTAVLVRNEEQKQLVLARWPNVEAVIGDLDSRELLIAQASKADIVLRTSFPWLPQSQQLREKWEH
jgi:nucleoside-diphosphate-sugar epimerase